MFEKYLDVTMDNIATKPLSLFRYVEGSTTIERVSNIVIY